MVSYTSDERRTPFNDKYRSAFHVPVRVLKVSARLTAFARIVPMSRRFNFMKLLLAFLAFALVARAETRNETRDFSAYFGAHSAAFVLYDAAQDRWIRHRPDLCRERFSPCSTFKIPNSLIALETGVADGPDFKLSWDGTKHPIPDWNRDHTLRSAYSVSCVWFYQELARRAGPKRMDEWIAKFDYGNRDTSGGPATFWLASSLKISPDEQVKFLHRLQTRRLPVSDKALDTLLDIIIASREGQLVYRGKTGTAGDPVKGIATEGWWVGSISTSQGDHFFATHLTGGENPSGRQARRLTESLLRDLNLLPKAK
jgi:beta-lactamase class D